MLDNVLNWLATNWTMIAVPAAVFAFSLIALLWLRNLADKYLKRWLQRYAPSSSTQIMQALNWTTILWCFIISAHLGVIVSVISANLTAYIGKGLWTLFLISLTVALFNISRDLVYFYSARYKISGRSVIITINIIRVIVLIITVLLALDIWGVPTSPFILIIVVVILAAALALRDIVPNLYAGLQLSVTREIKVNDHIKLASGEEGYVKEIGYRNTLLVGPDENVTILPNRKLLLTTITNYGRPVKKAREPFHFYSRLLLTELTGLRATTLQELSDILKTVPDPVIYYHTHHFLQQHFYLTPEPANDFSSWVSESLGDEALAERLASVDTMAFASLGALRDRFVSIIDEYLARESYYNRRAAAGNEFDFLKSVSVIFPLPYQAHDLREFIEAIRKVSINSLYYHMFESRLRLGHGQNDFSTWLIKSMDETDLAAEISRIDPYTYTLEGLRSTLLQIIEKQAR
jgi:small-conductance mechanosensitive channel